MAYYLLDTDAIIDYLAGFASSVSLIRDLHERGDFLCTCAIIVAEVYAGLHPQDREKAHHLLAACTFLPISPTAARQAGEWRYVYARRGRTLSTTDTVIAATAADHRAILVTGNRDDYPMEEVTVLPLPRSDA